MALVVDNGTKAKIPSEIKPPLGLMLCTYCVVCTVVCNAFTIGRLALSFSLYFPLGPIGRKKVIKHKKNDFKGDRKNDAITVVGYSTRD